MKYYLEKATPRLYFVVDDEGFKFSKKPMYKKQARMQQKALYAAQEQKKREKKGKRKVKGGMLIDVQQSLADEQAAQAAAAQAPAPPPPPPPTEKELSDMLLSKKLQAQQDAFTAQQRSSPYGQYPPPYVPIKDMMDRGIPWFLAQHPNEYSANPNEVMLYRNEGQFLRSPIYKQYEDRINLYQERAGYGVRFSQIIPGKPFRIVFRSKSFDDNNQYFLDLNDANEFMDFLDEAKDANMLTPIEFASIAFVAKNKAALDKTVSDSAAAYKIAYTQGTKDQLAIDQEEQARQQKLDDDARREAAQQQQGEDGGDSGFLGTLASALPIVGSVLSFL